MGHFIQNGSEKLSLYHMSIIPRLLACCLKAFSRPTAYCTFTVIVHSELINKAFLKDHRIVAHPGTDLAPTARHTTYCFSQAVEMLMTCLDVLAGGEALPLPLPPPLVRGRLKLLALLDLKSMFRI
jgi:hypothetical protein